MQHSAPPVSFCTNPALSSCSNIGGSGRSLIIKTEASPIVPDFTNSVYCIAVHAILSSLASYRTHVLLTTIYFLALHPALAMQFNRNIIWEIGAEKKIIYMDCRTQKYNMRDWGRKKEYLHGLPNTEMVKSRTTRLASDYIATVLYILA